MKSIEGLNPQLLFVCNSDQLSNGSYQRIDALFRGEVGSIIVIRHQGKVTAYRNLCVHVPRTLDCESDLIFDKHRKYLRCSMHGIVYSLNTGESLSEICRGKKLTAIRTTEIDQRIYIYDRRVKVGR